MDNVGDGLSDTGCQPEGWKQKLPIQKNNVKEGRTLLLNESYNRNHPNTSFTWNENLNMVFICLFSCLMVKLPVLLRGGWGGGRKIMNSGSLQCLPVMCTDLNSFLILMADVKTCFYKSSLLPFEIITLVAFKTIHPKNKARHDNLEFHIHTRKPNAVIKKNGREVKHLTWTDFHKEMVSGKTRSRIMITVKLVFVYYKPVQSSLYKYICTYANCDHMSLQQIGSTHTRHSRGLL